MTGPLQPSEGAKELAAALKEAIERVGRPGANNYPGAIRLILKALAESGKEEWNRSEYESIRDRIVKSQKIKKPNELDRLLIDGGLHLLTASGATLRPSQREELENSAMTPGAEILDPISSEMTAFRRIAHNYCLLYPERMLLLRYFAPPGAPRSKLKEVTDSFVFHRKVNIVILDYFISEGRKLGMLKAVGDKLILNRLPAPAIACFVVESYLLVGGHRLDVGLKAEDMRSQLSFILPPDISFGPWQERLGPSPKLLRSEVGGSQVRLDLKGFTWLVSHGLVDPLHVAKALKVMGAQDIVIELGDYLRTRVEKDRPKNAEVFLSAFS